MPELPEAETIVQDLRGSLPGRRLERVEVLHSDLVEDDADRFRTVLPGLVVSDVRRRGKSPVISVEPPGAACGAPVPRNATTGPRYLTVSLGMSGRLLRRGAEDRTDPPTHPGVRILLDDGSLLVYADVRRFGRLRLLAPEAYRQWSSRLGLEPLSRAFTGKLLAHVLSGSTSPIRSWLLDQRRVAGIGNIYANEALFMAAIHPRLAARQLTSAQVRRLHRALRSVLREAIDARGTTFRDYRTGTGEEGSYATSLRVYGREGAPCPRCGRPIERSVFGGRSAFFCAACQPGNDTGT